MEAPIIETSQTSQEIQCERKDKQGELLMLLMVIMTPRGCWGAFMKLRLLLLLILFIGRHQLKFIGKGQ